MARYKVKGPVVVLPTSDKSERYLYRPAEFDEGGFTEAGIKHAVGLGLIEKVKDAPKDEPDEGKYKSVSVKDLKADIEKRNEGREDAAKVVPAEPGNRPEIVAALLADDAK